jgi:altronate hydrolase
MHLLDLGRGQMTRRIERVEREGLARPSREELDQLSLVDQCLNADRLDGRCGKFRSQADFGNKAGGITTILEKSLGAVAKAGSTNLVDVYRYAEPVKAKGFVFMDTPGFDPVSATGQVAGGANLVCFTTGRGSVFGCVPAPSMKLATNTPMYRRMTDDMDVNCGGIADGEETVEACGQRIFDLILRLASGEKSKSEALGFGEAEFAPWQLGAVM